MNTAGQKMQKVKYYAKVAGGCALMMGGAYVIGVGVQTARVERKLNNLGRDIEDIVRTREADFQFLETELVRANDAFRRTREAFLAVRDTLEENGMKVKV